MVGELSQEFLRPLNNGVIRHIIPGTNQHCTLRKLDDAAIGKNIRCMHKRDEIIRQPLRMVNTLI